MRYAVSMMRIMVTALVSHKNLTVRCCVIPLLEKTSINRARAHGQDSLVKSMNSLVKL